MQFILIANLSTFRTPNKNSCTVILERSLTSAQKSTPLSLKPIHASDSNHVGVHCQNSGIGGYVAKRTRSMEEHAGVREEGVVDEQEVCHVDCERFGHQCNLMVLRTML